MKIGSSSKISVVALVLLITGAIDSVRNLPATALFGPSLIFFFLFSACVFLIPVALISAQLASSWPEEEGGVYSWIKKGLGKKSAFFAIWLQWVNTIVWYPSILLFIAGILAYLINPNLLDNKLFLMSVVLTVFWGLTFLGLRGLRASAFFASICAMLGMILPMALIIGLAIVWILKGNPLVINLSTQSLLPHFNETKSWVSLTAIMTSFLGMELAAVHVRDIHNPQKNYPRAMFSSVLLILSTMILGSLAIAFVLPQQEISLVGGVMQAFDHFFKAYHLEMLTPIIMFLILIGSLGSMINWIISPAKGLLLAVSDGFLPQWLYQKNKYGVAYRILLLQAVLVTCCCSVFLLFPSVNAIYWLFTDLSTELYMLMYLLLFLGAWCLKKRQGFSASALAVLESKGEKNGRFEIPGGKIGYYLVCSLGILGCLITLTVGFLPPENIGMGNANNFRYIFISGICTLLLPAFYFMFYRRKRIN